MEKEIMHTNDMKLETFETFVVRLACGFASTVLLLVLLVMGFAVSSFAQGSQPKMFNSPGEASSALFQAVQNEDEEAVERILGAGKEVTSSNDDLEDKLERERFSQKYQEMHRLVREPDGTTVLYIGAENWPFPIPLTSKNGVWYFDSDTGQQEILFRTIGENETTAIQVCHVLSKSKKDSEAEATVDDQVKQYAQSLVRGASGNADAQNNDKQPSPFRGYYFRIVAENSSVATTVSRSTKAGAVAVVAYPVDYPSSGVMTFIVTKDGTVYEKNLGSKTMTVAKNLVRRPDSSWHIAELK
jgi:hypothetical protein